jgi:ring-1,2-phenylacetyl-CoA epoxidase subunit PaaB
MSDTQWPNFEVFQQSRPGQPHKNVGSVHAPDAEMALLNARDVFVRRPNCLSLWVVPASQIFAHTAQQLTNPNWLTQAEEDYAPSEMGIYAVFQKQTQRASDTYVTYVGRVEATSPPQALQVALNTFNQKEPWVWWVCAETAITRSETEDSPSMFEPALDKPYRYPQHYHTVAEMHQIKQQQKED